MNKFKIGLFSFLIGFMCAAIIIIMVMFKSVSFILWSSFLLIGCLIFYLFNKELEKEIEKVFGKDKVMLFNAIGIYWFGGLLFLLTTLISIFYLFKIS